MLDIHYLRSHPDAAKAGVAKKGEDPSRIDDALRLDETCRQLLGKTEAL